MDRQTDRQTDRQADLHTHNSNPLRTNIQAFLWTLNRGTDIDSWMDGWMDEWMDGNTGRPIERQTVGGKDRISLCTCTY